MQVHGSRSKDLFDSCWEKLEKRLGSVRYRRSLSLSAKCFQQQWHIGQRHIEMMQTIVTPKEVIWLNGPPGAGKGANVEFIKRIRGLSHSAVMSKVLARHSETASIMENGGLVSDAKVCECLLDAVFDPAYASPSGCIVDGFPRSEIQVRERTRYVEAAQVVAEPDKAIRHNYQVYTCRLSTYVSCMCDEGSNYPSGISCAHPGHFSL